MRGRCRVLVLALSVVVSLAGAAVARAAVKVHGLFTDNMVLQQGISVPVWGTADEGEKVTVRFQGQEVSATARAGKWMVRLEPLQAGGPGSMTIQGANTITISNVLVGEVWVCSGQSNMAFVVKHSATPQEVMAASPRPDIRLLSLRREAHDQPVSELPPVAWKPCGPESVGDFSAVGYFFGRELNRHLKVPIGLIDASWGGTPAEAWTSREGLESNPRLRVILDDYERQVANYPQALKDYDKKLATYRAATQAAGNSSPKPKEPQRPGDPRKSPQRPCCLFNGMIRPLQPYAIRGVIWYQGESNAGRAYQYLTLFPAMIRDWRHTWGQGEFPFLFVQLAPFMKIVREPGDSAWAELREAQRQTALTCPNTAMAVITDVGDEDDIHPKQKEPVGVRLALAARATVYGEKVEYSGPVYREMKIEDGKAILSFDHVGGGLVAKGENLTGFTIAGPDGKFFNARAEIRGDKVVVSSDQVRQPVAVRYGWANYPLGNLWNQAGLPASPFRTDDFPLSTQPKSKTDK